LTLLLSAIVCNLAALEVIPEAIVFRGLPGQRLKRAVTLKNEAGERVDVETGAFMEGGKSGGSLKVSRKKFRLGPGESRVVWVSCRVPDQKGEAAGGFVVSKRAKGKEWIETRSVHQIYVGVAGTEVTRGEFKNTEARKETGRVRIETVFRNTGNVHIQPKLAAGLERKDGDKIRKIFEGPVVTILPNEEAKFGTVMDLNGYEEIRSSGVVTGFFKNARGEVENVSQIFEVK
jgi:hypothetical protein